MTKKSMDKEEPKAQTLEERLDAQIEQLQHQLQHEEESKDINLHKARVNLESQLGKLEGAWEQKLADLNEEIARLVLLRDGAGEAG